MKKKLISLICMVVVAVLVAICIKKVSNRGIDNSKDYLLYDGKISVGEQLFVQCEISIEAVSLDRQVGITQDGKQIYSILGCDVKDFICLRVEGHEVVFRNASLNPMTEIVALKVNRMVVREDEGIEDNISFDNQEVIDEFLSMMEAENIVTGEVVGVVFEDITLYSGKYKGLCYKLSYVIDENGDEYVYDNCYETAWKFTKHMFDVDVKED